MKILLKLVFVSLSLSTGGHLVRALFNGEIEYITYYIDPNPVFSFANEPLYFVLFFLFYTLIFGLSLWVLVFPNKAKKYMGNLNKSDSGI